MWFQLGTQFCQSYLRLSFSYPVLTDVDHSGHRLAAVDERDAVLVVHLFGAVSTEQHGRRSVAHFGTHERIETLAHAVAVRRRQLATLVDTEWKQTAGRRRDRHAKTGRGRGAAGRWARPRPRPGYGRLRPTAAVPMLTSDRRPG